MKFLTFLRHAVAALLLFLAWRELHQWYLYRSLADFVRYEALFLAALLVGSGKFLIEHAQPISLRRIAFVLPLFLLVVIPWGELLRINYPNTREDWSRQIFFNALFLYGAVLFVHAFRFLRNQIPSQFSLMLGKLSYRATCILLPVAFLIFTAGICLLVYKRAPIVNDTAAYLFQAKIFNAGKLFATVPPHSEFFDFEYDMLVMKTGRWFSIYPPGFPLLIAAAMLAKIDWLLDPILGAFTVLLWMAYANRWHGKEIAILLGLLCVLSPFFFQMYSTVMIHGPELFLSSAAIYLCRREMETPETRRKFLLFVVLLLAVLVRFFSLMIFLMPVLFYTGWISLRRRSYSFPFVVIIGIATGILLLGYYNARTTGDPLVQPYSIEYPGMKLGFGEQFAGITHSPARAIEQLSNSFLGLNKWLNGWYSGSLFFFFAFLILASRLQLWDKLLLLCCGALVAFYFFYVFQDLIFGPRFFFLCAPILLLFIARSCGPEVGKAAPYLSALLLLSILSFLPLNLAKFIWIYDPANDPPEYFTSIKESTPPKKIVFLDPQIPQDYINWNDPFLREPVLFCRDLGHRNRELLSSLPDHQPVYFRFRGLQFGDDHRNMTYAVSEKTEASDHSRVNFFVLTAALEYSTKFEELDSFDVTYPRLFHTYPAEPQLQNLQQMLSEDRHSNTVQHSFRVGLIHTAHMLLLPRLAYEKGGFGKWFQFLDLNSFRQELDQAQQAFRQSGNLGAFMNQELYKVHRRIDANGDHVLSDAECKRFVSEKILLFGKFV
jgi:hypothetical protein